MTFTCERNFYPRGTVGLFPALGGFIGLEILLPTDVVAHKMSSADNTVYNQLMMHLVY